MSATGQALKPPTLTGQSSRALTSAQPPTVLIGCARSANWSAMKGSGHVSMADEMRAVGEKIADENGVALWRKGDPEAGYDWTVTRTDDIGQVVQVNHFFFPETAIHWWSTLARRHAPDAQPAPRHGKGRGQDRG